MNKLKSLLGIVILLVTGLSSVSGQRYLKHMLSHKIVVNEDDREIVAYVLPMKQVVPYPDKLYFWFGGHKVNTTQGGYGGKLLNGSYQEFYINKNMKALGRISGGLKTGVWKNWDEHGHLTDDLTWNFGRKNGIYHKYDTTGRAVETGKYRNNVLNGKQQIVDANGTRIVYYKNGKVRQPKSILPKFISRIFVKS